MEVQCQVALSVVNGADCIVCLFVLKLYYLCSTNNGDGNLRFVNITSHLIYVILYIHQPIVSSIYPRSKFIFSHVDVLMHLGIHLISFYLVYFIVSLAAMKLHGMFVLLF